MNKARKLLKLFEDGLFGSPGMIFPESAKFAGILFTHKNEGFFLCQPTEFHQDPREALFPNPRFGIRLSETQLGSTLPTGDIGSYGFNWTYPGGGIDNGEQPYQAAIRECEEEIGFVPEHKILGQYLHDNGYLTYLASVDSKFNNVKLNNESFNYGWYGYGDLPDPLHVGVQPALDAFGINGMDT